MHEYVFRCTGCKHYIEDKCDPGVEKETLADIDNCEEFTPYTEVDDA